MKIKVLFIDEQTLTNEKLENIVQKDDDTRPVTMNQIMDKENKCTQTKESIREFV